MFQVGEPLQGQPRPRARPRGALHPARRPRAELLHLRDAAGGLLGGRPLLVDGRRHRRPLRAAPRRRQRGSAADARGDRVQGQGPAVHQGSEDERRARSASWASATASTRTTTRAPRSSRSMADQVFEVTGRNPLLDIALELERIALEDEYFVKRKLYPNVDFYSGLIYQAMGFPVDMFPVLFAIPRTSGWLAQWEEMLRGQGAEDRPAAADLPGPRAAGLRSPGSPRLGLSGTLRGSSGRRSGTDRPGTDRRSGSARSRSRRGIRASSRRSNFGSPLEAAAIAVRVFPPRAHPALVAGRPLAEVPLAPEVELTSVAAVALPSLRPARRDRRRTPRAGWPPRE